MRLFPLPAETIHGVSQDLAAGKRKCLDVLESCLARIEEYEAKVQAWVLLDKEGARAQARSLDGELAAGRRRGPLHGIPIGIKDIMDVAGMPTAAGSRLWANRMAAEDATIVARLRAAGAVILGKTVTTQYASFDPSITRNPWHPERTPGGSSSGAAATVACGMCLGATASQTGGSITRPASYCGVAGCKPTHGRVSLHGIMPLAPSIDHPGPIARTVRDLAILLDVMAGPDARDPLCSSQPAPAISPLLDRSPAKPPRLGRLRGLFQERADASVKQATDNAVGMLKAAGAALSEPALPALFDDVIRCHRVIMATEAAAWHERRLAEHPDDYLPRIRELLTEGLATPATEYIRCRQHQAQLSRAILTCFEGVDALVVPATTNPAPDRTTTGDPAFNSPWSYTGLPVISFPVGLSSDGLPLAIQLVGRPFAEADLFGVAAWCEDVIRRAVAN
jgi:aspartyl-tRNA(Asn)/glutamyl-tRNA(Gln) amidotransferase subunit A